MYLYFRLLNDPILSNAIKSVCFLLRVLEILLKFWVILSEALTKRLILIMVFTDSATRRYKVGTFEYHFQSFQVLENHWMIIETMFTLK